MHTLTSLSDWFFVRKNITPSLTIGFVPTMGALHEGHISLVDRSLRENDITVVSIYVNPTQFNDPRDFKTYPNTLESDLAQLSKVQYVLTPFYKEIYADGYAYKVSESSVSGLLEGAYRPNHFEGMLTVVLKLLNIVRPTRAYFGEKDYQQLELVRGMVEAFFIPTEIVSGKTIRDAEGLALSSRNARLTPQELLMARKLNQILRSSQPLPEKREMLQEMGFKVDYVEEWKNRRLAAVHLGSVRLIDNVEI